MTMELLFNKNLDSFLLEVEIEMGERPIPRYMHIFSVGYPPIHKPLKISPLKQLSPKYYSHEKICSRSED